MLQSPTEKSHLALASILLLGMIAVIGSALAFEHIGGYIPCKLCLEQRQPWYLGIPVAGLALIALLLKWPPIVSRGLLAIAGLIMLYSLVLGINHSGVEWGFWEGPSDCGAVDSSIANDTGSLLQQLEQTVGPSCTDASLRVVGLSFAGWNALMSAALAGLSFWAAFKRSA